MLARYSSGPISRSSRESTRAAQNSSTAPSAVLSRCLAR